MIRILTVAVFAFITLQSVHAAPQAYRLNADRSQVGFSYDLQGNLKTGTMTVQSADMRLDLENIPNSTVSVTLDANSAKAGFFFVTHAMKGPSVLNTAQYPTIQFRSTRVEGSLQGATITGDLTVRGVTRKVMLKAGLFRQQGTAETSRERLTVLLTGAIGRKAFGADGFPEFVGDTIGLRIIAQIEK